MHVAWLYVKALFIFEQQWATQQGDALQPPSNSLADVLGAGCAAGISGGGGAEMPMKGSADGGAQGPVPAVAEG